MELLAPAIDWSSLELAKDLQLLEFNPWVVITRRSLDFDINERTPSIAMMAFLNGKSKVFILSVLNRTWKEGQIQSVSQIEHLVHEFFSGHYPSYGLMMNPERPKWFSYQSADECSFPVGSKDETCVKCKKVKDQSEDGQLQGLETILHSNSNDALFEIHQSCHDSKDEISDMVEGLLDSKPLFEAQPWKGPGTNLSPNSFFSSDDDTLNSYASENDQISTDFDLHDLQEDGLTGMSDAAQIKILVNYHTPHSGSSKVSCSLCKKLFKNIESLKTHQRRIHKDGRSPKRKSKKFLEHLRDVVCPHCESRFPVGRDLFFHLKVVHCLSDEEIQKDFHVPICYICQQAFATYGLQQMHKKIDHLLGKWKCSICFKDFRHGGEVQEHYQGNHQPEEFHIKCALCQAELCFTTGFDVVKEHWDHCLKAKLTEDRLKNAPKYLAKRYVCDECGRAFQSQRLLNDHQDEHRGILKHSCLNCDYKTGTIRKLRSHMHYWHSGKPGYKPPLVACEICGQQVYKTNLWKHVANRHEKKAFSCDKCDKKFGTDLSLRAHKETVHPENTITCNICGIQVKHMAKLKVHMASHQPPKYFCRFCPKALKTTVSLANHERIHTGENPYKCDTCSFACATAGNLLIHKKRKHNLQKVNFYLPASRAVLPNEKADQVCA